MRVNPKLVIFILVVLAVGAIFVIPYLSTNEAKQDTVRQFQVTPNPAKKLSTAAANQRPVYLEFYGAT